MVLAALVREAAQRGQLLRAARDAAGRHVRLLVPVQNRGRGTDVGVWVNKQLRELGEIVFLGAVARVYLHNTEHWWFATGHREKRIRLDSRLLPLR